MHRREMIAALASAAAGLAASPATSDARFPKQAAFDPVRARIHALVDSAVVPSMAVAVASNGRIVWEEGFGFANRERRVRATPHTTYALASVGKAITAAAFTLLVDRGRASFDDPVETFIAPTKLRVFEGRASEVTPRALLAMRAGIPHGWRHRWTDDASHRTDLGALVERHAVVALPPNGQYHYANLSYAVLELAVERISGKSFDEFVRHEIFRPLGMKHSCAVSPLVKGPNASASYWPRADTPVPYWYTEPASGAGYRSSVHDLALWGMAHLGQGRARRRLFPSARWEAMHQPPGGFPYTCGWATIDDKSGIGTLISNGGVVGATSMLKLVPSKSLAVACLTNIASDTRITDTIADEIIAAVVPGYQKEMAIPSGLLPTPFSPDAALTGRWAGEVATSTAAFPARMEIDSSGRIAVGFGEEGASGVKNVGVDQQVISGSIEGTHAAPFLNGLCTIEVFLRPIEGRLAGYILPTSTGDRPGEGLPLRVSFSKG